MASARTWTSSPPLSRLALEQLAVFEFGSLVAASPLLRLLPGGDGHPVLVLPGFGASDRSTAQLRSVLRTAGHAPRGWHLGTNVGPHPRIVSGLTHRLVDLHGRHESKVSLVGWSLGGVYARELARAYPDLVRQVITLASPFRFRPGDHTYASAWYDLIGPARNPFPGQTVAEHERPPVPVPTTSIYTRTDGVVRWHLCVESAGPERENVEVVGTHSGLGHNIAAVIAIADRLAQPAGQWRKFQPPAVVRHLYPTPSNWATAASSS